LWDGSSWLVSRFWLVEYPFFVIKFSDSLEFHWSFSALDRLHPQRKSCPTPVY